MMDRLGFMRALLKQKHPKNQASLWLATVQLNALRVSSKPRSV